MLDKYNKLLYILFIISILINTLYLLLYRYDIIISIYFFWGSVLLASLSILVQIMFTEISKEKVKIIICEIILLNILFHFIYQIPYYGLYGKDAFLDWGATKAIFSTGFINNNYIGTYSFWPIIHILGAILGVTCKIDIILIAKWMPSIIDSLTIIFLYYMQKNVFQSFKVGLVSSFMFICLQHHILFGSLFVRETIAIVFMSIVVYAIYSSNNRNQTSFAILILLGLICVIIAHHLTSFMLICFLILQYIVYRTYRYSGKRAHFEKNNKILLSHSLISVSVVMVIAYWIYVCMNPLITIVSFFEEMLKFGGETYSEMNSLQSSSIQNMRGYITFYGFFIFHFIFGIILTYEMFNAKSKKYIEKYSFTLYLFFLGLLGISVLFFIPMVGAFPSRYMMYGWFFGFGPLVLFFVKTIKSKHFGVVLLMLFVLFNIYWITPASWSPNSREELRLRGLAAAPTYEDYCLVNKFNFSTKDIVGPLNNILAIFKKQGILGDQLFNNKIEKISTHKWIISPKVLNQDAFTFFSGGMYNKYKILNNLDHNSEKAKVYQNNYVYVYLTE